MNEKVKVWYRGSGLEYFACKHVCDNTGEFYYKLYNLVTNEYELTVDIIDCSIIEDSSLKPHLWCKEIHAWAEGHTIQFNNGYDGWVDDDYPQFNCRGALFRIKPTIDEDYRLGLQEELKEAQGKCRYIMQQLKIAKGG
jgi:hypothetical protein